MGFDVTDLLEDLFGGGPAATVAAVPDVATVPEAVPQPEAADTVGDPLAGTPFADWVHRPDCHGRMGWEARPA